MVLINEWLPNPAGKDAEGEFVEIFNDGREVVNVSGWSLKANSKTKFVLSGEVGAGDFLVFKKPALKISLVNTDGEVSLYDTSGKLVDQARFYGLAQEGKSFSLQNFDNQNLGEQARNFMFTEPTPGLANKFSKSEALATQVYSYGVPINKIPGTLDFALIGLGVAAVLTGLTVFVIKSHENLSKLFFARDEETWR
ncbi:MAG: Nucleic acid binding OB-fold tRNA/helicase-type [Parcubacteria group bacterium Gr01-1014_20]|nr:MAG: Nucleic acid binding OB-fold tRNA/helicase-type [Parcubacteria group bacterium Gr01-1014_20]